MRNLLSRPYRPARQGASTWIRSSVFGLFVVLFLLFFKPFGLIALGSALVPVALGFGATCMVLMQLLSMVGPRLMPGFFDPERWTVGREIVWTLVNVALIGLGNALYSMAIGMVRFSWAEVLRFELYTVAIGAFPIAVVVLLNEARLDRRYAQGARRFNVDLHPVAGPAPATDVTQASSRVDAPGPEVLVTIPSETGREDLTFPAKDLLFIRSAGNYMDVHVVKGAEVERSVVRGSLKRAEEAVAGHPRLLRCHKSYLVNLDHVVSVSGNAQGYHLHLDHAVGPVPVSRRLNEKLGGLLAAHP